MTEKEILKDLIDNAKQPNVTEWVFNVEAFLCDTKEGVKETSEYIASIKRLGDTFQYCANLIACVCLTSHEHFLVVKTIVLSSNFN